MLRALPALVLLALSGCSTTLPCLDRQTTASGEAGLTARDHATIVRLIRFARAPGLGTWARVPTGDTVRLGLGTEILHIRRASALASPDWWVVAPERLFRASRGPFSPLELIREAGRLVRSRGPYRRCVSPPGPAPRELAGLRRLTLQPAARSSCLEWFAVDVYVTRGGAVRAVVVDLWEP